jgi:hypothetical protein
MGQGQSAWLVASCGSHVTVPRSTVAGCRSGAVCHVPKCTCGGFTLGVYKSSLWHVPLAVGQLGTLETASSGVCEDFNNLVHVPRRCCGLPTTDSTATLTITGITTALSSLSQSQWAQITITTVITVVKNGLVTCDLSTRLDIVPTGLVQHFYLNQGNGMMDNVVQTMLHGHPASQAMRKRCGKGRYGPSLNNIPKCEGLIKSLSSLSLCVCLYSPPPSLHMCLSVHACVGRVCL